MSRPTSGPLVERKAVVYWCPRCNRQSQKSWHFCKKGPALIPQLDEETECERIEVVLP